MHKSQVEIRYVGIKYMAEIFGCSEGAIRQRVYAGLLPYRKLGNLITFDLREIEHVMDALPGTRVPDVKENLRNKGKWGRKPNRNGR